MRLKMKCSLLASSVTLWEESDDTAAICLSFTVPGLRLPAQPGFGLITPMNFFFFSLASVTKLITAHLHGVRKTSLRATVQTRLTAHVLLHRPSCSKCVLMNGCYLTLSESGYSYDILFIQLNNVWVALLKFAFALPPLGVAKIGFFDDLFITFSQVFQLFCSLAN